MSCCVFVCMLQKGKSNESLALDTFLQSFNQLTFNRKWIASGILEMCIRFRNASARGTRLSTRKKKTPIESNIHLDGYHASCIMLEKWSEKYCRSNERRKKKRRREIERNGNNGQTRWKRKRNQKESKNWICVCDNRWGCDLVLLTSNCNNNDTLKRLKPMNSFIIQFEPQAVRVYECIVHH